MVDAWVTMDDGVRLAATLYLPATDRPVPCLLEALPYRKDDVTASYITEYERFRDEFGYAVCRLDLRGTGSSEGVLVDEYPEREQDDLCAVIAWLAGQPWCTGSVGMFGTSYSGFNSIQVAMRRPPGLKAIVPIYATDDRYTDDVHYMGGTLRLLDLIDYPAYMVAMNALPPVPRIFGDGWRDEWRRRLDASEPWLLRWLSETNDGPYWRHGSLRPDYGRIAVPTMLVAGWADGYRNNTFRTYAALAAAGTPARLLVGPWSHMSASRALPGPHLDLVAEMARWFDRWLRDAETGIDAEPPIVYFGRRSGGAPEPDAVVVAGDWWAEASWPSPRVVVLPRPLGGGPRTLAVRPDIGTAAWNSCAGALPWGQPTDQRYDDAASLTWEWPGGGMELLGHARLALRVAADRPVASVSAKLCDVAPDGTSTLITRGFLNLTHRTGSVAPELLVPGEPVDVEVELEATAWTVSPGHRLRLSIAGTDWPNTAAPPLPIVLSIDADASTLYLPVASGPPLPAPATLRHLYAPEADDHASITWRVSDDVLARVTSCAVDHGSRYDIVGPGSCTDRYAGTVSVNRSSFAQRAIATATFELDWPETAVRTHATVSVDADAEAYSVVVTLTATEGDTVLAKRVWTHRVTRRFA